MAYPIDMVYLWCDGNDLSFIKRKEIALKKAGIPSRLDATGEVRFYDNEELRYSLRSLEMYAPWIHHIYIVTDRQIPYWLKESPKLTIIDHSEILPSNQIPCFNSVFIEQYIYKIPNLSEHFLYGNDDCFFAQPLTSDFFFQQGTPIIRVTKKKKLQDLNLLTNSSIDLGLWDNTIRNSWRLLYDRYHIFHAYYPHHNIDAYTKTNFINTWKRFGTFFNETHFPFRTDRDIERIIFDLDAVYSGNAILKVLPTIHPWQKELSRYLPSFLSLHVDSTFENDDPYHRRRILPIHPKLFCLNSADHFNEIDKKAARQFLEKQFPNPSSFEK